jgi:hypothetical protein
LISTSYGSKYGSVSVAALIGPPPAQLGNEQVLPPSIGMIAPVMNPARSDERN